ncbi:MAG TPA: flagellar export chaperone FliS [Dermatophilaceae bacterium]|nr:flagellar export chaperone FliS [Dermatophilaceae bacterium]
MTTTAQLRNRYATDTVSTASPARLVTMLYDRLLKDLTVAESGLAARDIETIHNALLHAQQIVHELSSSLDISVWAEGQSLELLYQYMIDELVAANMAKDITHVRTVREVVEPLRNAWHEAANFLAS